MRTPQEREGSDGSEERRKRNKLQLRGVHTPRYSIFSYNISIGMVVLQIMFLVLIIKKQTTGKKDLLTNKK